jgi:hypothetical protein
MNAKCHPQVTIKSTLLYLLETDMHSQNFVKINNTKFPGSVTKAAIGVVTLKTISFRIWGSYNVAVKSSVFWDITPCSPVKDNVRFGGIYRLLRQYQRIRGALLATSFLAFFLELFNFIYIAGKPI